MEGDLPKPESNDRMRSPEFNNAKSETAFRER